jgi:RNA polymerase sigma-70 factor (ECF subfamily)
MDVADSYARLRPQMLAIAYRMLGSFSEAEDVVQDAFIRAQLASETRPIESEEAYLTTITTRLAINRLRSARISRAAYPGTWLPEPVLTEPGPEPGESAELADTLSLALLAVLERLTPTERAAFLLHDVFGYEYPEIAGILGKTEANCRQIAVRARRHVRTRRPRFEVAPDRHRELTDRFVAACRLGRLDDLLEVLTADAVAYSDGGGRVHAALRPIHGRENVARFLIGAARRGGIEDVRPAWVNGQPARLLLDRDGRVSGLVSLDMAGGLVQTVRVILNPEKLRYVAAEGAR